MARAFPSGAVSDIIPVGSITTPVTLTCCAWVKKSVDSNSFPRVFDSQGFACNFDDSAATANWRFERHWSTAAGQWEWVSTQGATFNACTFVAWTYDGTLTSNNPTFYENGTPLSLVPVTTPSGTRDDAAYTAYIGNRNPVDGTNRGWGGQIDNLSFYNVVLTQVEVQRVMREGFITRGLMGYWKLFGESPEPDTSGNFAAATVTGTVVTTSCFGGNSGQIRLLSAIGV